jgi:hypothetical protein
MPDFRLPTQQELVAQMKRHWREFLPQTYAGLQQSGELEETLTQYAQQTLEACQALIKQGMSAHEAWALMRHEWAFPPAERPEAEEEPEEEIEPSELLRMWSGQFQEPRTTQPINRSPMPPLPPGDVII